MQWIFALAAGLMFAAAVCCAEADSGLMPAVWKEQQVRFLYRGRTSRYSCQGLHDRVRALLLDLGARRDLRIASLGCDATGLRRKDSLGSGLDIVFSAPAFNNPSGKALRTADPGAVVAQFEPFTIRSDPFRDISAADCELIEEFARQILPKFTTRNLRQDITCVPQSGGRFLVRGEILRSLPAR